MYMIRGSKSAEIQLKIKKELDANSFGMLTTK